MVESLRGTGLPSKMQPVGFFTELIDIGVDVVGNAFGGDSSGSEPLTFGEGVSKNSGFTCPGAPSVSQLQFALANASESSIGNLNQALSDSQHWFPRGADVRQLPSLQVLINAAYGGRDCTSSSNAGRNLRRAFDQFMAQHNPHKRNFSDDLADASPQGSITGVRDGGRAIATDQQDSIVGGSNDLATISGGIVDDLRQVLANAVGGAAVGAREVTSEAAQGSTAGVRNVGLASFTDVNTIALVAVVGAVIFFALRS